ncbi:MAG: phosphatidylserine decarboxylase, partial [Terriglobales bacterium]
FEFGSTVIVLADAGAARSLAVNPGEQVRVGQPLTRG